MRKFLMRRVAISAVTFAGVMVAVFFIVQVIPGDPAKVRAGPYAGPAEVERVRSELGLDRPLPERFERFVAGTLTLDLGTSIRTRTPVRDELSTRLPATFELALAALLVAVVCGVGLGVVAAVRQGSVIDALARGIIVLGTTTPVFWLGVLMILVFYSTLGVAAQPFGRLPSGFSPPPAVTGFYTVDSLLAGDLRTFVGALHSLALPTATLAFILIAPIANIARSSMLDSLSSEYVRTARAVGLPAWRDAFRNALLPVITTVGAVFGFLLGGNVLVERLFAWPGIGQLAFEALLGKDLQALQGVVLLVGALYILIKVLVDIAYSLVDPRIRLAA
jgi:ABC-type dipeptide/oligopeptide/nickel transport system permease component